MHANAHPFEFVSKIRGSKNRELSATGQGIFAGVTAKFSAMRLAYCLFCLLLVGLWVVGVRCPSSQRARRLLQFAGTSATVCKAISPHFGQRWLWVWDDRSTPRDSQAPDAGLRHAQVAPLVTSSHLARNRPVQGRVQGGWSPLRARHSAYRFCPYLPTAARRRFAPGASSAGDLHFMFEPASNPPSW